MKKTTLYLGLVLICMSVFHIDSLNASVFVYDELHRIERITTGDGTVIEYVYDALDNRTRMRISCPEPMADFTAFPRSGIANLSSVFNDQSNGPITSIIWDFGDGETSTEKNPTHMYAVPGKFTVKLTVTGPGGTNTEEKVDYITVLHPKPEAEFSASPTTGVRPLTVHFTDESTGDIESWTWTFGDGNTSTASNPSHTYENPGTYTVKLSVAGPGGQEEIEKVGLVTVGHAPPFADFTADPQSGPAPLQTAFTDKSTGDITDWSWTFGDGETSDLQNPVHEYVSPGDYAASLTVVGPAGQDSKEITVSVHGGDAPVVATGTAEPAATSAKLKGTANPNGFPTAAWFEWGETDSYGNSTPPVSIGEGTSDVPVVSTIDDLISNQDYHFRMVAENDNGTSYGVDYGFATSNSTKTIVLNINGNGKVEVAPQGVSCSTSCEITAMEGSTVELEAVPDIDNHFSNWSGDLSGNANPISFTADSDKQITARFAPDPSDLMAYFPFDGNANDETGNGNDGTVFGANLSPDRFGKQNASYSFDGQDDYIEKQSPTEQLNILEKSWTISAWVKASGIPEDTGLFVVSRYECGWNCSGFYPPTNNKAQYILALSSGGVGHFSSRDDNGNIVNANTTQQIDDQKWRQLVSVLDRENSELRLYVDGSLAATESFDVFGTVNDEGSPLEIGRCFRQGFAEPGNYFEGMIDDIRIYRAALDDEAVGQLYGSEAYDSPAAATGTPEVSATSAVLGGEVFPQGDNADYWFEWGETGEYGNSTPVGILEKGYGSFPVEAALENLKPETTYHFRLAAENRVGKTYGQDAVFTTPAIIHDVQILVSEGGAVRFRQKASPRKWFVNARRSAIRRLSTGPPLFSQRFPRAAGPSTNDY